MSSSHVSQLSQCGHARQPSMQANQANQAGQASVFLRDWGRVEPAVLVLLDRDPAFYIVKCRDITQEVRDVLEAVRAGDPSPGGASEICSHETIPEDVAIVAVVRKEEGL